MTRCLEKKILLSGAVQLYDCELLCLEKNFGILKYVLDRAYTVHGIDLLPGDVTFAFYWTDRPYTLYVWNLRRTGEKIYYFNIADNIVLSAGEFAWRDLVVDLLVDPRGNVHILDEEELPPLLPPGLLNSIEHTKNRLLSSYREIIEEALSLLRGVADCSFPGRRSPEP